VSPQHRPVQIPQLWTLPQLSVALPQTRSAVPHGSGSVGVQPHLYATPPPPHVFTPVHVPQLSVPPQPSGGLPQFAPSDVHVDGVHPHTFGTPPPPHVCGAVHPPHVCVTLQLSTIVPQ
jgi:hypothetical protein